MQYKLTEYSHGAGCGCKISPAVLSEVLGQAVEQPHFPALLVGNDSRDDAAVYRVDNGQAIISTTDFFMPIVDDARDFGRVASVNALSDCYAMGGKPLMAIAILGWPIDKLPPAVAGQVLNGAREICSEAGIPLAGGHSIDAPEPIFGLAVTGTVPVEHIKTNSGACESDMLFLTKPLGVGILTTARKQKKLLPEHDGLALRSMVQLNRVGEELARLEYVHAMTDVTGFGLAGHLIEMCEGSGTRASLHIDALPLIDREIVERYLGEGCIPGGTHRNFASYGHHIAELSDRQKFVLCDPQTSGGLLLSVDPAKRDQMKSFLYSKGLYAEPIGEMTHGTEGVMVSIA